MDARVCTLSYFLQGIIEICCLKIKTCARIVLFDRDEGGGDTGPLMICKKWDGMHVRAF